MNPNNRDIQHRLNEPLDNILLTNNIKPRPLKIDSSSEIKSDNNAQQKKILVNNEEFDLINFKDDCSLTQRPVEIDKSKHINDYQLKMLEEFLATTGNRTENTSTLTPNQEIEFAKFFDEYESNLKLHNSNPQNAGAKLSGGDNIIIIGNPTIIVPKLVAKDEDNFKVDENFIDELMSRNPMKQLKVTKEHEKKSHGTTKKESDSNNYCSIMNEIIAKNDNIIHYAALPPFENAFGIPLPKDTKIVNDSNQKYLTTTINDKIKLNNANIDELVTKHDIRYLETVNNDDKKYRSELITENEKVNLTPGPTLYQKSLLLPKIMERLAERKKATVHNLYNFERKECDKNGAAEYNNLAGPSKSMKPIINPLPFPSNSKLNNNTNRCIDPKSLPATISNTIPNNKEMDYPSVESLRVLRKGLKGLAEQESSSKCDNDEPRVLIAPEVLMENCNKQRYLNLAASRLFDDFIRSG